MEKFPGGEKSADSCHVSGCHRFFGSDRRRRLVRVLVERERFLEGFLEGDVCHRRRFEGV